MINQILVLIVKHNTRFPFKGNQNYHLHWSVTSSRFFKTIINRNGCVQENWHIPRQIVEKLN